VHPEHRKRGLAKELHRATIDWINRHARDEIGYGEKNIILLVMVKENNRTALSLHEFGLSGHWGGDSSRQFDLVLHVD